MTLQEILNMVMLKYPHPYLNDDVVTIANQVQQELFRRLYRVRTATMYDVFADNPFYPIDFSPQKIISILVNGEEYPSNITNTDRDCKFYYLEDGNTIGIFPTPKEDIESGLIVFHYTEPPALTTSELSVEPAFDRDYHHLIVYHICKELAEASRDYDTVNGFIGQINSIEAAYKLVNASDPVIVTIDERW